MSIIDSDWFGFDLNDNVYELKYYVSDLPYTFPLIKQRCKIVLKKKKNDLSNIIMKCLNIYVLAVVLISAGSMHGTEKNKFLCKAQFHKHTHTRKRKRAFVGVFIFKQETKKQNHNAPQTVQFSFSMEP